MRMLYKIVLGLLLFNAFLTLFSPMFSAAVDTGISENAIDYESSEMTIYTITDAGDILDMIFAEENAGALAGMVIIGTIAVAAAIFMKQYIIIGVGLFVSIVVGMYVKMSAVIANIGSATNNVYVSGIITIIGIAIGVFIVFVVIDMFAPGSARE